MIVVLLEAFTAFGLLFFICEIGQRYTSACDGVNDVANQFNWYSFPVKVQQMAPIIILITQQPIAIECFGSVMCLRDTFKKVSPGICQYIEYIHAIDVDLLRS